ncbi:glycosyltransferase family 2 protein [Nostoc sp. UHCC 0870]|uniref:glycosyltransferase family 2 protein n=1 Tax=Nostoc sp. UHCC 0870 TaxID=2914041 RepID=UPI001EDD4BAF|nr:glycosyltransferase family 2 protein [Nostoc sp. UHCC 0870]UKO97710.1 glycosyltransferase family 2 protein [Nostoc sp. UHCC 0870]
MLVFIIPLKSKHICQSWERVCQLFERTLRSTCNQTTDEFRVIVVCNEKPNIEFTHKNIIYVERDFALPSLDWRSKNIDRTRKLITGLIYARNLNPSHIMCVDADDCISKHLADFVNRYPQANGWLIKKGYSYTEGDNIIRLMRKGFEQYCGTSNIVRYDLYDVPEIIDEITEAKYVEYIFNYYRHREIIQTLAKKGTPLEPLPFMGAVYTKNGQNNYLGIEDNKKKINLKSRFFRIKALFDYRWITKLIRDEFQLYDVFNE